MSRVYLVSKAFDPILGVITGVWAYGLYERRANRPKGHTLPELLQRKWAQRSTAQEQDKMEDEGWKELEEEVSKLGGK
ncbi:hypothetical protein RQP46_007300 [Phenoliferia psychrophenolica]